MKRIISWMLVLFMGLSLVPAGFAEEFFAEEAFVDAPAGDENVFFEEGLFVDAAFFAAENAEEAPAAEEEEISLGEFEARSIVSFVTDQVEEYRDPDGNVLNPATEGSTDAE